MVDLQCVLKKQRSPLCKRVIRTILKRAGYKWRSARIVLTSTDPDYRDKVDGIKTILSELGRDEAFFSIDEYGPFAVKKKGGVKRVAPGQEYVVPQRQKSKGWLILTAALELSANQVTHFYSRTKNTDEMIKMAELLRTQYRACRTVYLSWDAASWHISKKLLAHLEEHNKRAEPDGYPVIKTAPLPAGGQFLNVIESVFSGMARAIIHNSDYPSVEAAKEAIDGYFSERNAHFSKHPKRAGQKIWRMERVPSEFAHTTYYAKNPSIQRREGFSFLGPSCGSDENRGNKRVELRMMSTLKRHYENCQERINPSDRNAVRQRQQRPSSPVRLSSATALA
jgi:hypothetical protein